MGYLITDAQTDGQTYKGKDRRTDRQQDTRSEKSTILLIFMYFSINGIFYGKSVGSSVENDHL